VYQIYSVKARKYSANGFAECYTQQTQLGKPNVGKYTLPSVFYPELSKQFTECLCHSVGNIKQLDGGTAETEDDRFVECFQITLGKDLCPE
jgi:hypothetical protein